MLYRDTKNEVLSYRGRDIADLFEHCEYEDVAYLLIYGKMPTDVQKQEFLSSIVAGMDPPDAVLQAVSALP